LGTLIDKLDSRLREVDLRGRRGQPAGRSPFPGLLPFDPHLAWAFFGRAGETEELARWFPRTSAAWLAAGAPSVHEALHDRQRSGPRPARCPAPGAPSAHETDGGPGTDAHPVPSTAVRRTDPRGRGPGLVLVVGPSGAGKSSLVLAGLWPRL